MAELGVPLTKEKGFHQVSLDCLSFYLVVKKIEQRVTFFFFFFKVILFVCLIIMQVKLRTLFLFVPPNFC